MSDIEESLKRITSHNGVMGVAVLDDAGKLARYVRVAAAQSAQSTCSPAQARLRLLCRELCRLLSLLFRARSPRP